jgi:hypothetical protein
MTQVINQKYTDPTGQTIYGSGTPEGINTALAASGISISKDTSGSIPASSVGGGAANLPPSPTPGNANGITSNTGGTLAANGINLGAPDDASATDPTSRGWIEKYLGIKPPTSTEINASPDVVGAQSQVDTAQGTANVDMAAYQAATDSYNALNAQLAQYNYNASALIPAAQQEAGANRLITQGVASTLTASELRKNALAAAPIQFQALIAQAAQATALGKAQLSAGILKQAQDHVDKLFEMHMTDAANQYNYQKDVVGVLMEYASKKEENQLKALEQQKQNDFTIQQNQLNYAQSLATEATKNGQAALAGQILKLDPTDPNYMSKLGGIAGGITQKSDLQFISGTENQRAGYFDKTTGKFTPIGGGGGDTTTTLSGNLVKEYGSIVDATANLVGAERGKTTRTAMSSAINRGDYVSAYAQIANNVEESLTGSPKINFADSRTDYAVMGGLRDAVQAYADGGGNMGLLVGTEESIKRKLGIDSGKASELAVQLCREFQVYRLNMTGAAFSPAESRDYAAVNPTLGKSLNLNLSVINGALNQLENRIINTIEVRVPGSKKLYQKISNADDGMSDDDAYTQYLNLTKQ